MSHLRTSSLFTSPTPSTLPPAIRNITAAQSQTIAPAYKASESPACQRTSTLSCLTSISGQEEPDSIAYTHHISKRAEITPRAISVATADNSSPSQSLDSSFHRYQYYHNHRHQEDNQDNSLRSLEPAKSPAPTLTTSSTSSYSHSQTPLQYYHHPRDDEYSYHNNRHKEHQDRPSFLQRHSTGGSVNTTAHSSDPESDWTTSTTLSSPASSMEPPSRLTPAGTLSITAARTSRTSSLSAMTSPSSPKLPPSSATSATLYSSSMSSPLTISRKRNSNPSDSSFDSSANTQVPSYSADLSQKERSLAASILIALADQQGDGREDKLEKQNQQEQPPTSQSLSLPSSQPMPSPSLERRSELPVTPMEHYSPHHQHKQPQHHMPTTEDARRSSSVRSSPEYFGHHHQHHHHHSQYRHAEDYRDHRDHWDNSRHHTSRDGYHHPEYRESYYQEHIDQQGGYNRSPGPHYHQHLTSYSSTERYGSSRYPSRPSSPPGYYERRRSPSYDDAMPPRKRHHTTWSPSEAPTRSSPVPLKSHDTDHIRVSSRPYSNRHVTNGDSLGTKGSLEIRQSSISDNSRQKNGTYSYPLEEYSTGPLFKSSSNNNNERGAGERGRNGSKSLPPSSTTPITSPTMPSSHRVRSTSSSGLTFKPTAAGSRSSPTITSPLPKPASLTPISAASNPPTSDRRGLTTTISTTTAPATTITSVIKTEIPIPEYKSTSRSSTTTASSSPSIITTTAPVTPTTPIVITKTTTKTATATPSSTSSSTTAPTPTPRTTPLTPAEELEEELSKKRFKNTLAARRSRAKKVMILEQERLRVTELESVNKALQIRVAVLEAEQKQWLIVKETMGLRIARLETELAHARELIKERE